MPVNITSKSFRKITYTALILSILGLLLVCLPIIGPRYTIGFASSYIRQVIVGYIVMIFIIELIGVPLRSYLPQYWAGGIFAFFLFIAGSLAASTTSMFLYEDMDFQSYVIKPLFWLGFFGFIPALIIGFMGSKALRSTKKMENKSE